MAHVRTDSKMPPFGVAEAIDDGRAVLTPGDLFQFWLMTHADACYVTGPAFWRTAVLRECLPSPDSAFDFEALGALL